MADFLIRATASTGLPDSYEPGDVVEVRESGAGRGSLDAPPQYCWLECPEVTQAQVADRMEPWLWTLDWEIVARSVPQDGWRLRMFNESRNASGTEGILTRDRVETYLGQWGGVTHSVNADGLTFDWSVYAGVTSRHFWDAPLGSVTFQELAYDTATGIHRIEARYSVLQWSTARVVDRVRLRGGTVVQSESGIVSFDIHRSAVLDAFRDAVRVKAARFIRRRRWCISSADLALVLAQPGGVMQVTAAQLAARLVDKMQG